jgi:ferric-dicitrate binding protein FerR (iron transport regulator)
MQTLFEKYIQGKCTVEEYEKVKNFITDPENNVLLSEMMYEHWIISSAPVSAKTPNLQLLDSIHHKIALKENKPGTVIRVYKAILAVAAVLIIGLVTGAILFLKSQEHEITNRQITTPYGAKTLYTLPDGSEVWLNSGSTITFPDEFKGERIVELAGEAYFSVKKGKHPFSVKTRCGDIQVLGTEFDVKVYENEPLTATLESGIVKFTYNSGQEVELKPGMQVVYDEKSIKIKDVETRLFTSWKDGQLIFRDEPLQNIISQLERWYNVKIILRDDKIKGLKYTGTIEMESFSEVLELIKVTTPISYSFDRKTRILTISTSKQTKP